jgi:hypothetical protein
MKNIILFICALAVSVFMLNSCSEQPTSVPDIQRVDGNLSKTSYVPGTDITEQLRDDLNAGLNVTLPAGHFYVSESIVVLGYPGGTIKGAGKDATIIEAAPEFEALPNPFFQGAPTSSMIEFDNATGDVTIKGMTLLVIGDTPATGHVNPFTGWSTNIDNAIVVHGIGISATFRNLRIKGDYVGDAVEGAYNGYNLTYPLVGTGWGSQEPYNLIIRDCEIEYSGSSAIEFFFSYGGSGDIKDNVISNVYEGIWLAWGNMDGMSIIKDNRFNNITTAPIYYTNPPWWTNNVCIKNNTLDGAPMTDDCQ